jgi:transcriptional regulator with XRE-family HTH domain
MKSEEAIRESFGENIRHFRERREWSQETLAFRAGLDRTYVNSVENGKRNISLVNIVRLAEALELSPRELFSESPKSQLNPPKDKRVRQ